MTDRPMKDAQATQLGKPVDVLHVTTVPMTLLFLRDLIGASQAAGYRIAIVTSPGAELDRFAAEFDVAVWPVPMTRQISPLRDILALFRLVRIVRRARPSVVHGHTPKGGLLAMLAAWVGAVPVRVYHLRGFPALGRRGLAAVLLRSAERVSCGLAHRVICVAESLRAFVVAQGICSGDKAVVLGSGSGQGVRAADRFNPAIASEERDAVRAELGIPLDATVVGFVGRVARDKGFEELANAWRHISGSEPGARLLVVGPLESEDPVDRKILDQLRIAGTVSFTGMVAETRRLYAAMDIVALPSYREGFPNVLLEAAAMERPVVASRVPGCMDAVVDGVTGTLVEVKNEEDLRVALLRYLRDGELRREHGAAGRARVLREFRPEVLAAAALEEYRALGAKPGHGPALKSARRSYELGKRAIDFVVAMMMLIVTSPLFALIGVAVLFHLGRPVFFRQVRPGQHGRSFVLRKFRTMRADTYERGRPLSDAERLTGFGRLLRSTSLDELPSLLNVMAGDMSLVGPRPLLMEYLPLYSERQAQRHSVKPGVTGWAQINGRNALSWEAKFELDLWYVENRSLRLDLSILMATLGRVLRREGITHPGSATAEKYRGPER